MDIQTDIPFDQFARYKDLLLTLELLYKNKEFTSTEFSILDVGGYFTSIEGASYLPIDFFFPYAKTVTVDKSIPQKPLCNYFIGDGAQLPFSDNQFNWINASDVLEHIPKQNRNKFIKEMFRCSKDGFSFSTPISEPEVELAEEFVLAYFTRVIKLEHKPLIEHRRFGLASLKEISSLLNNVTSEVNWTVLPSGNLYRWIFLMISRHLFISLAPNHGLNPEIDSFYNNFLYNSDHSLPSYRKLFIVSKNRNIKNFKTNFLDRLDCNNRSNSAQDAFLMDLLSRIEDQERWKKLQELQDLVLKLNNELNETYAKLGDTKAILAETQAEKNYLHRELNALSNIWPVKLWRKFKSLGSK